MSGVKDVDSWRKFHLAIAEFMDAWRIIPRLVVVFFGYAMYKVTAWYMSLEPYVLEKCTDVVLNLPEAAASDITNCIVQAPTTQHTALVSALFALAATVFAFYSNNGRKWGANPYLPWNKKPGEKTAADIAEKMDPDKGGNGG